MVKKCFFCGSKNVVRNGLRGRRQLYKCKDCGRQFLGGERRYITQDPDIEASRALLDLTNSITKMDKESFMGAFRDWYDKYQGTLNERVHDKRIKKKTPPYMRPRLRSAYFSLKRNMPLLWTFYDHPETGLPNTNNALEGLFSDLKTKVRVHAGISRKNRKKLLDEHILRNH